MKRMLIIGCLITFLAFCFGCSSNSDGNAYASDENTVAISTNYYPRSIRMFDLYGLTEGGHIFFHADTKAWVVDEDEQAFLNGDKLRYGGTYALKGMLDAPIIIAKPLEYRYALEVVDEADYGVTSDQIMPPGDVKFDQRLDIRVYSPEGKVLYFFPARMTDSDIDLYKAGGNLRFQDPDTQGVYLLKAPIVTITENVIVGPILWTDGSPQGDPL